ncbi:RagB/SusD family nutrient uptake outer membrane protein [Mucilaginibacter robiniae]|uniref:RagB/SusD family nutrient uptake outer membrane protein n=1 Tax=Mucilaginibacter robiniae TaxID=2728022 RepID=A0A7L5DZZ3_9SPHI|nr:RagB/SusD family nutrient uptake outer membrane protein [Mucilaginibacter robiniae]QJD96682.1 RagB/SusD family nutrient uptake outer membrane protein [Mucilaginibacter robiniae]
MKFNKYILGVSLCSMLVVASSSCKKVLDVTPTYTKDGSQIFTSITDYEYALTGAYSLFRQTGYYGNSANTTGAWSTLPDMMGEDLLQTTEDLTNSANLTNYTFNTLENDILTIWTAAYRVVNQANIVLRNIDQFNTTQPKAVNRIKGQALAIRAFAHFDLLRYWGADFDRNSTGLGVPYVTVVDQTYKPSRPTVKEDYDQILANLTAAETLLQNVDATINTSSSARTLIDVTVVRAMLARVYLYTKNYTLAESYATQVITAIPLATADNFPNVWKDSYTTTEVIWSVAYNSGDGSPSFNLNTSSTNRNSYKPTSTIINLFDNKTADIRFSSYIASRTTGTGTAIITDPASTITRKIVNKYVGKGSNVDNVVNWKVLRTGEMYLIRAEARAMQTGKESLALADLNTLRAARITGYSNTTLTGQALIDAIFTERRKELFAEGHRWFDLKRTTRTIQRTDLSGGAQSVKDATSLPSSSKVWVFPIPQSELDANANIRNQQSTGW